MDVNKPIEVYMSVKSLTELSELEDQMYGVTIVNRAKIGRIPNAFSGSHVGNRVVKVNRSATPRFKYQPFTARLAE